MEIIKIAVTGGPSGGKTTLIEALKKELGQKCALIPEAATILYRGGFPRFKNSQGQIHAQKAIFYTQKSLEDLIAFETQKPLLVCDRGSLDSIAYWPENSDHFFETFQTTRQKEWERYDWVIHLDTASVDFYESTNPLRTENYAEAQELNIRVKTAWEGHPRRVIITESEDFLSKMTTALAVIRAIMAHQQMGDVLLIAGQKLPKTSES